MLVRAARRIILLSLMSISLSRSVEELAARRERRKCRSAIVSMRPAYREDAGGARAAGTCARWKTAAMSRHGNAPGPLLPGGGRDPELHAGRGAMQCLAAGADARNPAARGGAWRLAAAARAQADPFDGFRPAH